MGNFGFGGFTHTKLPSNVQVGNYTTIAEDCIFHNRGSMGNHLCIYDRKVVFTNQTYQPDRDEVIVIENDVWIGHGVRVLPNVRIGNGAIIGAGAVIGKDVPPFAVVVGNPQIIKRFRFTSSQINALQKIKWWEWEQTLFSERIKDFYNIDFFIRKYSKT